jgi:hypothetical protein
LVIVDDHLYNGGSHNVKRTLAGLIAERRACFAEIGGGPECASG